MKNFEDIEIRTHDLATRKLPDDSTSVRWLLDEFSYLQVELLSGRLKPLANASRHLIPDLDSLN